MSCMLALLLVACSSHTLGPPVEPGPESHFFLASDADGDRYMVRVTAATAEVEAVGPRLDFVDETVTGFTQNAPVDRALINTRSTLGGASFAFRAGAWAPLCREAGSENCYAWGTGDLGHLVIVPSYTEDQPTVYQSYPGRRVGAQIDGRAGVGTEDWLVWGSSGEWSLSVGGESEALTLFETEIPLRAFEDHLMSFDRDTYDRWFRAIPSGEASPVLCPGGERPVFFESSLPEYAKCAQDLYRVGDGSLVPTGVQDVDDDGKPVFVLDAQFSLRVGETAVRLYDREGRLAGEYARSADELGAPAEAALRARVVDVTGSSRGAVALVSFHWFTPGDDDFTLRSELLLLTFSPDGSVHPFLVWEGMLDDSPTAWLARSVDRIFWITDEGRLMMRDTYEGVMNDVSAGWDFAL